MARTAASTAVEKLYLATSVLPQNYALKDLAIYYDWNFFRGCEDDVLSCFSTILEKEKSGIVIRVCVDNFAIDLDVIDGTIEQVVSQDLDIRSPFLKYKYPFSVGVEISTRKCLFRIEPESRNKISITERMYTPGL